jgi:RNA polymerase sigma-70 factor (ECF subfamily)
MRAGDAFDRLYAEHAQPLYGFLVHRTGDPVLAEDLLASTFERALRGRAQFNRRRGSARTWLYTIALNLLRDHARRGKVEQRALQGAAVLAEHDSMGPHNDIPERLTLRDALASLSPDEREAIALRYGGDLTLAEVADVVGANRTAVEARIYRGLRKLRDLMS